MLILHANADYVPVYFQACKGTSAIGTGVDLLAFALVLAPTGIISGLSVNKTGRYRPQLWLSWVLLLTGIAAYTSLHAESPRSTATGLLVIIAAGTGILTTTTYFPVLAPRKLLSCYAYGFFMLTGRLLVPVSANGPALAYFMFLRNFAQVSQLLSRQISGHADADATCS
jgi:hypothetical protein